MKTGQKAYRFSDTHPKAELTAMAFDSRGRRLITGGKDGTIKVWNHNNGMLLKEVKPPLRHPIGAVAHVDCGDRKYFAATAGNEATLYVDEIGANKLVAANSFERNTVGSQWHDTTITALCFVLPSLLCTGDAAGNICVSDVYTGALKHRLESQSMTPVAVRDLCGFQNSQGSSSLLFCLHESGDLRVWNLEDGHLLPTDHDFLPAESATLTAMRVNQKDWTIVLGDSSGSLVLCSLTVNPLTLAPLARFPAHNQIAISALDISEKHDLAISVADDTIKLWTRRGRLVGTFGERTPWDLERRKQRSEMWESDGIISSHGELHPSASITGHENVLEEHHEEHEKESPSETNVIGSLEHIVPKIRPLDAKSLYRSMQVYDVPAKYSPSRIGSIFSIPNVE